MHDSWADDRELFRLSTLPLLKQHGKTIGRTAEQEGEATEKGHTCLQIMRHYRALHASFDPVTHLLLRQSLDCYLGTNS